MRLLYTLYEVSIGSFSSKKEEEYEKFLKFSIAGFCLHRKLCLCLSFFVCKIEWLKWVELSEEDTA